MRTAAAFTLLLLWLGGCLDAGLTPCGDRACPFGHVCTAGGCAAPADVETCRGLDEGTECRASNGVIGTCQGGSCRTGLCGNGSVDLGEVCDDQNQTSGDGCRGDCLKIELCGDGVPDQGEACDDGNLNAADGCDMCVRTEWAASAVVGSATSALETSLAAPEGVAVDGSGRIYIADTANHRVRRVELDGSVTNVAGTGTAGFGGDNGPATSAELQSPGAVAIDGVGRLFVADTGNHRIRRIEADGTITTIAGTGLASFGGDGGPAILAAFSNPHSVAVDGLGRVFIADTDNQRIRRIEIDGQIATVAGTGTSDFSGDGGPATAAEISNPYGIAVDPLGRVVVADTFNQRVRRIDLDGTISTIAGTGVPGFSGDGGAATMAELSAPVGVTVDTLGTLYIADAINQRIRRVAADGTITTFAGAGSSGFSGDGGAATAAELSNPIGVGVDPMGRVVIADTSNQRVRRVDNGIITTAAGTGAFGFGGDGGEATSAQLVSPFDVTVDSQGRIVFADTHNNRIRRIELDGSIALVAGAGTPGFSGDGGLAVSTQLFAPSGVAIDALGRVVIADTFNHRIRRVALDGTISTIAGTGVAGSSGDNGPAIAARLTNPNALAIDAQGRILIADTYNLRIRRIELDGRITTVAGNGSFGFGGDDGPATAATLGYPYGVALDSQGRIVIADTANHRIRRIASDGTITTIVGLGVQGDSGDGGPALSARLNQPRRIVFDAQNRMLIVDSYNSRIRRVDVDGTISTVAGVGVLGSSGDAALATDAQLSNPLSVAVDLAGRIVIADTNNHRIRRIASDGTITTIAGKIDPSQMGPVARARLEDPQALVAGPTGMLLVAGGTSGTLQAVRAGRVEVVAGRYPQSSATAALARFRTDTFGSIGGAAFDAVTGKIYITETSSNRLHVVTPVDPANAATWTIATLANASGSEGFADGAAATARFRSPTGVFLDRDSNRLYIADTGNHAIRALDLSTQTVSTIVNTSRSLGFAGDAGPATAALLFGPTAITQCPNRDLFIADTSNNRVRRVVPATGLITTVLGDGVPASSGEGEPASTFPVDAPRGLACDDLGNVFVTSTTAVRLLPATDAGTVDGDGAVRTIYGAPPRATFPSSVTSCLTGLVVAGPTTVKVADACTGLVVALERAPL